MPSSNLPFRLLVLLGLLASASRGQAVNATFYTVAGLANGSGAVDGAGANSRFSYPNGVAVDGNGNVYVADSGNSTIRKISSNGKVTTFAGVVNSYDERNDDGIASAAWFLSPMGLAVDNAGNVYVADTYNCTIRKISSAGMVTTIAGGYYAIYGGPVAGATDGVGRAALFNNPGGVVVDGAGNLFVADTGNSAIRKITSGGVVTTLAGLANSVGSADGSGSAARFRQPNGLALDAAGNLYVADTNNSTIRKITSDGVVTTLAGQASSSGSADGTGSAARFNLPASVTVDAAGNLYVADTANSTIRKITPGGVVTTIAGTANVTGSLDGSGNGVRFSRPAGVAVDQAGNLYVADSQNFTIRRGWLLAPPPPLFASEDAASSPVGQSFIYRAAFIGASGAYGASGLPAGLSIDAGTGLISGTPTVTGIFPITLSASNAVGSGTGSLALTISAVAGARGHLINLSVRATAGTGDSTLIVGVVVGGNGTSGPKPLLIRGVGPSLLSYGTGGVLADPSLELILQGAATAIATNDNWAGDAQISSAGAATGAFPFTSATSKDAALYVTPSSGNYSVKIAGVGGGTGIALGEIYDASGSSYAVGTPRLLNISARAPVGTGTGLLFAGFVIDGPTPRTVLIRAAGPTLASYQVSGTLADPQLELTQIVNGISSVIARNDNWDGAPEISSFGAAVGAFAFSSPTSKDAAILVTLPPGIYSARAFGAGGTTGVALIEIYEVP